MVSFGSTLGEAKNILMEFYRYISPFYFIFLNSVSKELGMEYKCLLSCQFEGR